VNFCIREVTVEDLPALLQLMEKHAAFEHAKYSSEGKLEALSNALFVKPGKLNCLVIQALGQMVKGYFTYTIDFSTWDAQNYLHLDCLYLEEDIRGEGIGGQVIEYLRKTALAENCINIQWQTPIYNYQAINFYKKHGATSKTKERFVLTP
jgi:GNAT superfamily N-acetyltransferase